MTEPPFANPLIGIIGGTGNMGLWFRRLFEGRGLRVEVASRSTALTPAELAERADVLILSVPIASVEHVATELGPRVRQGGLLMDLTSLKAAPVAFMLAHSSCAVIGTHPLFGPSAPSLAGHTVVLCPARAAEKTWLPWLSGLLEAEGGKVVLADPNHHDRMMAVVQGLTHFDTLAFALGLARSGLGMKDLLLFSTPNLGLKLKQAARLLRQDASLYAHIGTRNAEVPAMLQNMLEAAAELEAAIAQGQEGGFQALFQEAARFFQDLSEEDYRGLARLFVAGCEGE
ncbi:MAG: prephenate dehydrogenase/arogenate dehydrogenase family protein [Pseudomonadota bacterium]